MIDLLRGLLVLLYTAFWAAVACVALVLDRSGESVIHCARIWARWILKTCRIEVERVGVEALDRHQPFVLMSNHQGVFDVVALVATLPVSYRFVAKRELARIPVFGWALVLGGHVIVDRSDRERSVASLERAARQVREGTNVVIYPEGTRSETGEVGELKSGGFHLAIAAGVPIVPVSVSGSNRITRKGSIRVASGRIRVCYGKPIPTRDLGPDDRGRLKERVREMIIEGPDPHHQSSDEQTANIAPQSC